MNLSHLNREADMSPLGSTDLGGRDAQASRDQLRGLTYDQQVQMLSPGRGPVQRKQTVGRVEKLTIDAMARVTESALGGYVDRATSNALAERILKLSDDEFKKFVGYIQSRGLTKKVFELIGGSRASSIAERMDVEFRVHQFMFHGVDKGKVHHQVGVANKILGRHGMKVKGVFKQLPEHTVHEIWGKQVKSNTSEDVLGNKKGTIKESDINRAGKRTMAVLRKYHPGKGKLAAFWFNDIIETYGGPLHGQALTEESNRKYKNRESVFCWEGANSDTLAHELGHVLGGDDHHHGKKNLMAAGGKSDKLPPGANPADDQFVLDERQIRRFKSSLYAKIKAVRPRKGN